MNELIRVLVILKLILEGYTNLNLVHLYENPNNQAWPQHIQAKLTHYLPYTSKYDHNIFKH